MSAEDEIVSYLSSYLGVPVLRDVPAQRPDAFATVERTGGPTAAAYDEPTFAVQCWGQTNRAARAMSDEAAKLLADAVDGIPGVFGASVAGSYRNDDPESGHPRYQVVVQIQFQE